MKIKIEKVRVNVYGARDNYRFSFIVRWYPFYEDVQVDIDRMIIEARKEAIRIFRESYLRLRAHYGGHLDKIVWLHFDNGLKVEVR